MSYYNARNQIPVPLSSDYTVVIPFHKGKKTFDRDLFSSSMVGGRVTVEEVEKVLTHLETATSKLHSPCKATFVLMILYLIPFFMLMKRTVRSTHHVPVCLWIIYAIYVLVVSLIYAKYSRSQVEKVVAEAKKIIKNYYQAAFEARGLRWHIPQHFPLWIELYKDYREQHQTGLQIHHHQPQPQVHHQSHPSRYPQLDNAHHNPVPQQPIHSNYNPYCPSQNAPYQPPSMTNLYPVQNGKYPQF